MEVYDERGLRGGLVRGGFPLIWVGVFLHLRREAL